MSRLYHSLEWYTRVYTTIDYGLERVFEALLTLDGKLSRKNFQHPMGGSRLVVRFESASYVV